MFYIADFNDFKENKKISSKKVFGFSVRSQKSLLCNRTFMFDHLVCERTNYNLAISSQSLSNIFVVGELLTS